jgi:uncharacterized membrane-anchored protein
MKKLILPIFILVALVQWLVPGKIIWDKEEVLRKGKTFRFETAPVDPSNPFFGRYIYLQFQEQSFDFKSRKELFSGQDIYVFFTEDKRGFVKITGVSEKEPVGHANYFKTQVSHSYQYQDSTHVSFDYAFNEFYMDEYKAPEAETVYNNAQRDTARSPGAPTYAAVKIWNGKAVLVNVMIGDKPIGELIKNN